MKKQKIKKECSRKWYWSRSDEDRQKPRRYSKIDITICMKKTEKIKDCMKEYMKKYMKEYKKNKKVLLCKVLVLYYFMQSTMPSSV